MFIANPEYAVPPTLTAAASTPENRLYHSGSDARSFRHVNVHAISSDQADVVVAHAPSQDMDIRSGRDHGHAAADTAPDHTRSLTEFGGRAPGFVEEAARP